MKCTGCQATVQADARFCSNCGTKVEKAEVKAPSDSAERRHITVLFCDLVGSTQLSRQLDPEEMREIVQMYQTACGREVEQYDGYIAQYLGDGILVYFGYPNAHSDTAERAVLAAVNMRDAVARLSAEIAPTWGVELAVRIGVHSGVVVVGEMGGSGRTERLALGDAPNIAARVQGEAGVNEVLVSEATAKLASNGFVISSRGTPPLKGVSEKLELHLIEGIDRRASWRRTSNQDLFGRSEEFGILQDALAHTRTSGGQLVEVIGETGVGKSQLLWSFANQVDVPVVDVTCRDFQKQTPLGPFADWLLRVLGAIDATADDTQRLLEQEIARLDLDPKNTPGLSAFLGLSHPDLPGDPGAARGAMLEALCQMLLALGHVVLVVDDAHLSDATTMEALDLLAGKLGDSKLLLLVGNRQSFDWKQGSEPAACCTLGPLPREDAAALVRARVGANVAEKRIDDLVNRADGMPIYLVELAQSAVQGLGQDSATPVPTSLQGLLMNRLDVAGAAKRTALEASVLGREFERDELAAVTLQMQQDLEAGLAKLVEMELLDHWLTATGQRYQFRHQLVRDLAYDSILKGSRAQLHRRIATHLESQITGEVRDNRQRFGRIAQHYLHSMNRRKSTAEDLEKGVQFLMRSASSSLSLSAYVEASGDVENARVLAERLPQEPLRWRLESEIFNQLSVIHRATIGFGAPEVEEDLRNARAASEKLGDDLTVATVSLAIWSLLVGRGSYGESLEIAEKTLADSARIDDKDIQLRALAACGNSEFWLGDPQKAFDYCARVLADYGSEQEGKGLMEHGWDAGVHANQQAIWSAWLIGHTDVHEHEARLHALAERIGHPLTTAMAENASCMLQVLRRDADAALAAADRLSAVADQFGLGFFQMFAALFRAEALARKGEFGEAFALADQMFRNYQDHMGGLAQTFVGGFMVRVYAAQGDLEHALYTARHALKAVEACDERVFESSLRRQEAHLTSGEPLDLSQLELCGDLTPDGMALSLDDPRNPWIS